MSMILTRSPLEVIVMNGGGTQKRRSARLSGEGNGDQEPPMKKAKINGSTTTTVDTKQQDGAVGGSKAAGKKKKKEYEEAVDDFQFRKKSSKRKKAGDETATVEQPVETAASAPPPAESAVSKEPAAVPTPAKAPAQKKTRRRFPTTPEREVEEKRVRRSKRLSDEKQPGSEAVPELQRASPGRSHANGERSPSPARGRPITVGKKRQQNGERTEQTKVMQIALPFADTPIQRRNKEMRKTSAEGHRRSSTGMRGKRASSVIDEGRGHEASDLFHFRQQGDDAARGPAHRLSPFASEPAASRSQTSNEEVLADLSPTPTAMPHAEVPTSEFFKHISADITEPRRMRNLLGWCGTRLLPSKPLPPKDKTTASNMEFQAQQAARIIQEELSLDLMTNGTLSDWFSRDESAPPLIPLRKKANPRNITNAAKAEELERELGRLKAERAEWDTLVQSTALTSLDSEAQQQGGGLSPLHTEHLDSPQRAIFDQLTSSGGSATDPANIQQRLESISDDLEFTVDQFAHGIHVLTTSRATAERAAEKSLADAAEVLESRQKSRAAEGKAPNQMDALRGLARVLNTQRR